MRLENLTNRLFRQANLVNELESVFTVFDHAPWTQRIRCARKSESIHHRCESSSRGGLVYTFDVCSVFERSLGQKPVVDEDSWLLAKCASQDRTIGQLADTLTERSNTNLVRSVFERSLFAHAIGQKPRSQPFDDDDRWLLAKRASWDRAFESEPRSRSIFVRFSKARFQLARLARRRLFGVGSRLVTERVCRNLTKTERMYVYKIPPLGSWLGEHKSVIIIYIYFLSYCTQTVSHFVQEMVHTKKDHAYITNYTVHIVCATLYLWRGTTAPPPPFKYNAFNNNYSAKPRRGCSCYALVICGISKSLVHYTYSRRRLASL